MGFKLESLLDQTGWRILAELQADGRLSYSELGRRVGLSAPAAAERVRRMEDAGIITGYRVEVGLDKLFPIQAIIRVCAPEENCQRLAACARALREVVQSFRVTGGDRLVLTVTARSVHHLDDIIRQIARYGTPTVSIVLSSWRQAVTPSAAPSGRHLPPRSNGRSALRGEQAGRRVMARPRP